MNNVERIPRPYITMDAAPYWQAVKEGRLIFQRCAGCGSAVWQPRSVCPYCTRTDLRWEDANGRGTVYSFSTIFHPPLAIWTSKVPYTVGLIHMQEDYYFFSEIVAKPEQIRIGAAVSVFFDRVDDDLTLPKFRLIDG